MKTALVQVFVYFGILQILAPILVTVPCIIYMLSTTGTLDPTALMQMLLIPAQLVGIVLMTVYLWKAGFISKEKVTWSPLSFSCMGLSIVFFLSGIWLVSILMSHMEWIPNIMEQSFDVIISSWAGILAVAVAGPILEELLFRGAVEKLLLQQYAPGKAILFSALIFGVFHINPAQIVPAFLMGLMLGWMYYKTASLIPCIVVHILNNSLSVYLMIHYPDVKEVDELVTGPTYWIISLVAIGLLVGTYYLLKQKRVTYLWKKERRMDNKKRVLKYSCIAFLVWIITVGYDKFNDIYILMKHSVVDLNVPCMVLYFAQLFAYIAIAVLLVKIVKNVSKQIIFDRKNVRMFRGMIAAALIPGLISGIINIIGDVSAYSIGHAVGQEAGYWIAAALFFSIMSEIFQQGLRLKEEQDLTV